MIVAMGPDSVPGVLPVTDGRANDVLAGVFSDHYESLVGLARLLLDERGQAEEVVQEAFARTLDRWPRVRNRADPLPYLRRTVVNLARGGLRRRVVARRHRPEARVAPSAETRALHDETRRNVLEAIATLSGRQRECVVLRYFHDCSTAETAESLGISEGAVKTHLHRALASMATRLSKLAPEDDR